MNVWNWFGAVLLAGGTACGPMPGYQMPHDETPAGPRSPPAPPPAVASNDDDDDPVRDRQRGIEERERITEPDDLADEGDWGDDEASDEGETDLDEPVRVQPRAPRPSRYAPPRNWEAPTPDPQPRERSAPPGPEPKRVAEPEPAPAPADFNRDRTPEPEPRPAAKREAIKIIPLDDDSYYLIDSVRKLCFLRHKESMTALDCAKIPEAGDSSRAPEPARPTPPVEPARMPEPTRVMPEPERAPEADRMPEPAPAKREPGPGATPSPDEMMRFEAAFIDIYCDRKSRDETLPEARIREHGLTTVRYETIEGWWASDENAWYSLTARAAKSCTD